MPVEVKYRQIKKHETTRSLQSFISAYQPDTALVVNLNYKNEIRIGKTKVCFVLFYELISYNGFYRPMNHHSH